MFGVSDATISSETDPNVYAGVRAEGIDYGLYSRANVTGVYSEGGAYAGLFRGTVGVIGDFIVINGGKSAAVPHPDGSLRRLNAVEAPESWFEDFGRAQLADGYSRVDLDPDFAALIRTEDYHVFLTAEGESKGLYVSARSSKGFEVREQEGGRNTLAFSFRLVAKRKDVAPDRLPIVEMPREPSPRDLEPGEFETLNVWQEDDT